MANPFATTVMPLGFRFQLAGIMLGNMLTVCCWEYFFVNGWLVGRLEGAEKGTDRKGLATASRPRIEVEIELTGRGMTTRGADKPKLMVVSAKEGALSRLKC